MKPVLFLLALFMLSLLSSFTVFADPGVAVVSNANLQDSGSHYTGNFKIGRAHV